MLTQLIEFGTFKCDEYWPEGDAHYYGVITVEIEDKKKYVKGNYGVRKFKVTHLLETRTVYQYQYKDWPDHGVAHQTMQLL